MSTLRSALDELRSDDLRSSSDAEVGSDVAELLRAMGALEAEVGRRVVELERRRAFRYDGHLSMASWLASRCRLAWSAATRIVREARALEMMPAVS